MKDIGFKPKLIHPIEIYLGHLTTINGVGLTQRETDVVSCLLNGRNTKGTANFLSIAPKTVATHLYNATKKFGCASDGMITLLTQSGQFSHLKEYYAALLTDSLFKKSLKEIAQLVADAHTPLNGVLVYWQKKPPFLESLQNDLTEAGITVSLEGRKEMQTLGQLIGEVYRDAFQIYFIPETFGEQLRNIVEEPSQLSNTKIFFFPKTETSPETPGETAHFTCINASDWPSYYCSVFAILKKILPHLDLTPIFARFEEKAVAPQGFSTSGSSPSFSENLLEKMIGKRGKRFSHMAKVFTHKKLGYALWGALGMGLLFLLPFRVYITGDHTEKQKQAHYQNYPAKQENLEDRSIRSDLVIASEPTLLDRSNLIARIDSHFQKQANDIQTIALIGIGGAGKTTLARQYARSQKLPVVWEVNAETQQSLRSSFEKLAYAFSKTDDEKKALREVQDIKNTTEREEKMAQLVKEFLKLRPGWILIYDGVEQFNDIQKYFPADPNVWGKGKVILTTRDGHIQNNSRVHLAIQVGELTLLEKLRLFFKIMDNGHIPRLTEKSLQNEQAEEFLNNIPPFPLDISTAAYYLKATNISYQEYLNRLHGSDSEFVEIQENILKVSTDYPKTRYKVVTLSLKDFIHKQKDFAELLLLVSVLDSKNIPRDLLDGYKGRLIVDHFIYYLKKYSLTVNSLPQSSVPMSHILIHPSTQHISFAYLSEFLKLRKDASLFQETASILDDYLNQVIEQEDFPKMQVMAGHIEKFLNHRNLLTDFSQGLLISKLGCLYYFLNNGKSPQAIKDSLKIFTNLKALSSEGNLRVARSLLHIGAIYTELRFYEEAKELLEKVAAIYRKGELRNEVELSWALSHLGNVYRRMGNYETAKDHLEESICFNKRYGADNRRIARTLSYLGSAYRGLGFYQKSIEALEEGMALYKKDHSEDHYRIGWILTQLGYVYQKLGDYQKAKAYLENGFFIFKKYFPENHKNMCLVLAYLGNCLRKLGDYKKSQEYLEKSLKIHQKRFDENHLRMGWILFHLASTYKALGKCKESQELFDKVLEIYGKNCKGENIRAGRFLRNMAEIYLEKNQLGDAESLIKRSLDIFQHHNHLETYMSLEILGEIYAKKSIQSFHIKKEQEGRNFKNQAVDQFNQALKIIEQRFPKNSAHIERIRSKIKEAQEKIT